MNFYGKERKIQLSDQSYLMNISKGVKNDQYIYLIKSITNKMAIKINGK